MPDAPPVFIVMGVAGTGKTTVGALLAGRLGWVYAEADDFHPAANVDKMAAGVPLTDADRQPWLAAIGRWIDERAAAGEPGVVTCSGLKRVYRDRLREGRPQVRVVFLDGSRELIARRLTARHGHFMRAEMLDSQFADLEPPQPGEGVTVVPVDPPPNEIVEAILAAHPDVRR
ncbi:MAG TPA: gluconokinase [Dactylosporangium sp.]|jgi:gluconokinase|nr:gluconokinase [Dactylosporangium sp.]